MYGARFIALVVVAGVVYGFGRSGSPLCDPDSVVQLHGVWHVLSALALVVWADSLLADDR